MSSVIFIFSSSSTSQVKNSWRSNKPSYNRKPMSQWTAGNEITASSEARRLEFLVRTLNYLVKTFSFYGCILLLLIIYLKLEETLWASSFLNTFSNTEPPSEWTRVVHFIWLRYMLNLYQRNSQKGKAFNHIFMWTVNIHVKCDTYLSLSL